MITGNTTSSVAKSWSPRRGHRLCCRRRVSDCHLPEKQGAHSCCNLALVAEMQKKWLGFPKDSLASFSILAAQGSSKLCPSSCRLGGISLEILSVGVRSGELGMKERKTIPLGWESVRGGGVLRACRKMYSCVITSLSQCIISFLLVGKDKAGSAKRTGLHMLFHVSPAVD